MDVVLQKERELVAAAQVDPQKFGSLYVYYYPLILRFVSARVYGTEIAEDLTAAVFEKALNHISRFEWQSAGSFSAWLYRIAKHQLIDFFRSEKHRRSAALDDIHQFPDKASLEDHVHGEVLSEKLGILITHLPEKERRVVYLKFYQGYTNKLIAKMTGLSESNVGTIVHRTVNRMAQHAK